MDSRVRGNEGREARQGRGEGRPTPLAPCATLKAWMILYVAC